MSRLGRINVERTWLDRLVETISPERGLARFRARGALAVAGQWFGGSSERRAMKGYAPASGSADADNLFDLPKLRDRSRDLCRNNPLALGAINTVTTSAVGTGLVLRSRIDREVLGLSDTEAQAWQRQVEREFRTWAENPLACDAAATLDFYGLQALAFRSALESADCFALLPYKRTPASHYELKVHLVEGDRVTNKDWARDSDTLAGGVQMDAYGAPVAYHFLRTHPGSLNPGPGVWDVVPAFGSLSGRRNVVHLYDKRRPGQTRGMPYLAPVIETLKQLGDYTNAEVTAAVVSGMFTAFVKTENGEGLDTGTGGTGAAAAGSDLKMGAGAIIDLAPGEDVEFADPNRPNTAFDPFVQAVLRQVGVALELPFELLIKHFTASYSAARAALLEAWRFFKGRRAWLAAMFCQPVYEAFLEEAIATGRIDAPGFFDDPAVRAAYCGTEWVGDSPGQIDPLKEVQASKERMALLLSSRTDEAAQLTGADWEDTAARIARENQVMDELGLKPAPAPSALPAQPGQPAPPAPGQGDPDDADDPERDPEKDSEENE